MDRSARSGNNVYADPNGSVYQRAGRSWESRRQMADVAVHARLAIALEHRPRLRRGSRGPIARAAPPTAAVSAAEASAGAGADWQRTEPHLFGLAHPALSVALLVAALVAGVGALAAVCGVALVAMVIVAFTTPSRRTSHR
jgi:hypothetical protein